MFERQHRNPWALFSMRDGAPGRGWSAGDSAECIAHFADGWIAIRCALFHAACGDSRQFVGQFHAALDERPRRVAQNRGGEVDGGVSAKGALAARHLVQHDAEGEDVGAMIEWAALQLLGRHVRHRAQHDALARLHLCRQICGRVFF